MTTPDHRMFALTIRQPWAWAIAHGGKSVENRSWSTPHRGLLAIHAGSRGRWDSDGQDSRLVRKAWLGDGHSLDTLTKTTDLMPFGAIIAVATFNGAHTDQDCYDPTQAGTALCSLWAVEWSWHWPLENVTLLDHPVICPGRLGVWRLDADIDEAVRRQIERTPS